MDKYEFNIKLEQIKKLAAKKEYKEASAIAKSMNWNKVKDWATLATIINVQEAAGDYEEARDMAILAYNRNLGGRKLVYKLTEFFIKVGDFENAHELYEEYAKISAHDVNKYILLYDLRRAERASDNELVEILEEYKEQEIDEKYMYELAKLYYKTGRKEECIRTCDNLVLWFQDGIYVEKAVQLKTELNVDLTNTQKKILEDVKNRKEDVEANKEELFKQQQELARLKNDEVEELLNEDIKENISDNTNVSDNLKTGRVEEEESPFSMDLVKNDSTVDNDGIKEFIVKALEKSERSRSDETSHPVMKAEMPVTKKTDKVDKKFLSDMEFEGDEEAGIKVKKPKLNFTTTTQGKADFEDGMNKASISLKELIANAKKNIENNYEKINKEDEEEARRAVEERINKQAESMEIEVQVPDYNLYDTQNLQMEIASHMTDIMAEEEEEKVLKPSNELEADAAAKIVSNKENVVENATEDEQIEGQLSLSDWMESVREEKYGKQDTREFSKAELERMLDEKDEKSAAYEKIIAEKKAEAQSKGKEFDEREAKRLAEAEVILGAVKRDLAMRTGKAALKLEQEAAKNTINKNHVEVNSETTDEVMLVTSPIPTVNDEMINNVSQIIEEETAATEENVESQVKADVVVPEKNTAFKKTDKSSSDDGAEKKLTGELAKIFRKYKEMPGVESQIAELMESIDEEMQLTTSSRGNIIISGNTSSDKTDLARTIVRALNYLYPDKPKKIAKTSGESINQRGIAKAMTKLRGTALIVEGAGSIQPKRVNEIINCLEQDTDRMVVIFEDSDAEINVLLNFNPELANTFNHRITLKQYTVNELVDMAKRFARKRKYEVDDSALLELYLKIDKIHSDSDSINLDDIKDIINQAIVNSEKRASRRFFGGLKKKRGENGDVIFLTEADFKDR
ncbi:MAG: hypothetical protein Q4F06_02075 [Eubacteriales bacterium]|nr:hypothetical protein [Eubacteriales bacterium]